MGARRRGDPADVFDDVLRFRMGRRSGRGESAAIAHRVVLHVLNDQDGAARVEIEARRLGRRGRVSSRPRARACKARSADRPSWSSR